MNTIRSGDRLKHRCLVMQDSRISKSRARRVRCSPCVHGRGDNTLCVEKRRADMLCVCMFWMGA